MVRRLRHMAMRISADYGCTCYAWDADLREREWTAKSKKYKKFCPYISISYLLYYLLSSLYTISLIHLSLSIYSYLSILIHHLFVSPPSGIVPGRQNTVMRRHCAPEGEAQPPHDSILPANR
jgi:hypothetical protein